MTRRQTTYVVVLGLGGFAGLLYLLMAVGPFMEPSVTPLGQRTGLRPGGRPGQGIARANALHAGHVSAAVQCGECHSRGDAGAGEHRCVSCHEDRKTGIHAGLAGADGRECVSCHDFLHLPKASLSVWGCPSCHVAPDRSDAPTRLEAGPQVAVHGGVFCGDCHAPHGGSPLRPRECTECHEQQATEHAAGSADGGQRCLICHVAHAPAATRRQRCEGCHTRQASSALFAGHDRCGTCHRPHGFTGDTAKPCGDGGCHRERVGATAAARRHHGDCTDCHRAHSVRGARARCGECHRDRASSHPASKQGTCLGCHPAHSRDGAAAVVTVACSSCHRDTASDRTFHEGARCGDCHRPHGKLVGKGDARFCLGCHAKRVGDAAAIRDTARGHAECKKCHGRPHAPSIPSSCAVCHKRETRAAVAGHRDCKTCHETHTGSLRARAECRSCHTKAKQPDSHRRDGYAKCRACHRPHDGRLRR